MTDHAISLVENNDIPENTTNRAISLVENNVSPKIRRVLQFHWLKLRSSPKYDESYNSIGWTLRHPRLGDEVGSLTERFHMKSDSLSLAEAGEATDFGEFFRAQRSNEFWGVFPCTAKQRISGRISVHSKRTNFGERPVLYNHRRM